MMNAVLSNPSHPKYGVATIPFPIPRDQYTYCMELLAALEIGDAVKADCKVEKIDSFYTVLKRAEMLTVNVEELNYLAKRLESFDTGEAAQFQAMAHKLELFELKDLINLTFCCQQATVITDFSDLAAIGRDHYMNLHGGSASVDELNALDGKGTARQLIESGGGTVTPYGVAYDNGMKLEQVYDGRFFPCYYYKPNVITVAVTSKSEPEDTNHITWLFLPMVQEEVDRALLRGGITDSANVRLRLEDSQLPNEVDVLLDIFADEGITGTSACKRKDFLRMIRQCRKGKIDMILAKSVSRFARNTVDTLSYTRELRSMGIPVIFEEQNINSIYPESEFLITIHGAFAQSESEGISSRVKWGKHQAMRTGKANIQYKTLLGYEKGPDGEMVVNAEQAETVRKIYELYLSGQTLRNIKETLETGGFKNAAGTTEWTTSNLRTILSDEKYCGDVLLQKTFIRDCISKQVIRNTGQLPMYLIQNHHEAIIPRERFDAVQMELARRRAQTGGTKKSAPTGMSRYSGKYALSGLLFCGECGTAYRRVVWTQHGEKRAVWRCSSRLDYGKKYCKESPTLDEAPLQQAVLAAINASMSGRKVLADQLVDAMEQELAPVPGESMSLGDIDRAVTELGKQFDMLLAEAANGDVDEYAERFRAISTTMEELKRRKAAILSIRQEQEQIGRRIHAAASAMTAATVGITEWDDGVVYQMLEKVTVLAGNRIKVTFRNGVEFEQTVDQPKRRKFA